MSTIFFRNSSNIFQNVLRVTFNAPGTVRFTAVGGGGGGGGNDAGSVGQGGSNGERIDGEFRVSNGTVIAAQCGGGGQAGASSAGSAAGGPLGRGFLYGAAGGNAGAYGSSGGGGGGGGATFIMPNADFELLRSGTPAQSLNFYAIAAGGGGGAGAGLYGGNPPRQTAKESSYIPSAGSTNGGDGGGGGGGGGGRFGGKGGTSYGDVTAQSGANGQSFIGLAQSLPPLPTDIGIHGTAGQPRGSGVGGFIAMDFIPDNQNTSDVYVKSNGVMTKSNEIRLRQNNAWKDVNEIYVRNNGQWVKVYQYVDPATLIPVRSILNFPEPLYSFVATGLPQYPLVSCGQGASGGGSASYIVDFGTSTGTAGINWESYGVPDDFEIVYGGITRRTGYTSGSGTLSFQKSSVDRYGIIHVNRLGANYGTGWYFTVICP